MAIAEWTPAKLDELGFVGRGKSRHRPRNAAILYGGRYPFFQTGDIKAANFYLTEYSQTYSDEGLAQSKLWKPGTLCITIAANIAESAILGIDGCFPDSVVGFVADQDKADVRFIKYYLEILKRRIQNVSHGATQDNLSVDKLLSFDFLVPPLPTQHRIAGILSAYDELIENSQRRIKILETMARALYREWFVHFRFPGYENHPRVASALGEIPQGWEVKSLGAMTKLITKGTTPTTLGRQFQEDGVNFVKAESIEPSGILIESKFARIDAETHELLQRSQLRAGDILFSIAGVIGRVCSIPLRILPANTNQALAIVRCSTASDVPFFYMTLRDDNFKNHCLGHVVQTAQANVSLSVLKAVPIALPPKLLLAEFNARAESLLRQIEVLSEKIQNLRRTRDLLLPRLLSGQIHVEAA